jgi:hypothetical protein
MNNFHCLLPEEKYTMTSQTSFDDREIEFVIKTANHLGWDTCYFCHFFEEKSSDRISGITLVSIVLNN